MHQKRDGGVAKMIKTEMMINGIKTEVNIPENLLEKLKRQD